MLRLVICDDDASDRKRLRELVEAALTARALEGSIEMYSNADAFLRSFAPGKWHIVFLDIYMPGMNGMRAGERLRLSDANCRIVFVTSSSDYVLDSYAVHAAGYLLKPYGAHQLDEVFDWCLEGLSRELHAIDIISERERVSVRVADILYIEVYGRECVLHTLSGDVVTNRAIGELEKEAGEGFIRAHRSCVVNMEHIVRAEKDGFLLTNGAQVPLSVDSAVRVKQAFYDWAFQRAWQKG